MERTIYKDKRGEGGGGGFTEVPSSLKTLQLEVMNEMGIIILDYAS